MNNTEVPYKAVSLDPDRPSGDQIQTVCTLNNTEISNKAEGLDTDRPSDDQIQTVCTLNTTEVHVPYEAGSVGPDQPLGN